MHLEILSNFWCVQKQASDIFTGGKTDVLKNKHDVMLVLDMFRDNKNSFEFLELKIASLNLYFSAQFSIIL